MRIHPRIIEHNPPRVVNNSFKEQTAVSVFTLESSTTDSHDSADLKYRVYGIELELHGKDAGEADVALPRTTLQERRK